MTDPPRPKKWLAISLGTLILGLVIGLAFAPQKSTRDTDPAHTHATKAQTWTCAMHPQVQASEPGLCPICAMDLVPLEAGSKAAPLAPNEIKLSPRARALAQIQTSPVRTLDAGGSPRELWGELVQNENSLRAITTWIGGRIDRLLLSSTGQKVRRGQVVAKMYSPEVYAAHQVLLVALEQERALASADPYAKEAAKRQVDSATQKLKLLGVKPREITAMSKAKKPWTSIAIRSTSSGTVLKRHVRQGEFVKAGDLLFDLADLDTIWAELDLFPKDLEHVKEGQAVTLYVSVGGDTKAIEAKVAFIEPTLDKSTQTATARLEIPNPKGTLKPGMLAHIRLEPGPSKPGAPIPLVIPDTTPLFAGKRSLVYVEAKKSGEDTIYKARDVVLGERVQGHYRVIDGLDRGERVVTHGAFAIDSDLQIRGGLSLMARPDDMEESTSPKRVALTKSQQAMISAVLQGYLNVQEPLANDEWPKAKATLSTWSEAINAVNFPAKNQAALAWRGLQRQLAKDVEALQGASTIEQARDVFLNTTLLIDKLLLHFGNTTDTPIRRAHCPMAKNDQGAHWYQRAEVVDNVYFGNSMRRCGEITQTLAPQGGGNEGE